MALPLAIAGVQAGIGAVQSISGLIQSAKAKRELENLEQPFYKIQDELFQNRNLAAQQTQMGVPQATMDYMTTENQRGLGTSLDAMRQSGGSANNTTDLFMAYQRGTERQGMLKAQGQIEQMGKFLQENTNLAGQKTMQWVVNKFQPFQAKTRMLQQRIGQGDQQLSAGLNSILGAGASYMAGQQNQDLLDSFKKSMQPGGAMETNTVNPAVAQNLYNYFQGVSAGNPVPGAPQ